METLSSVAMLKKYFDTSRPLTMEELKKLSIDERKELADLAAKEMGYTKTPDEKYSK